MSIAEKLSAVAMNEKRVYEAGKRDQYDAFWDAYQQSGTRMNYREAFSGIGWTEETFKPKYPIKIAGDAERIFHATGIKYLPLTGVDFSQMTHATFMFAESLVEHLGVLDISNAVLVTGIFFYMQNLHTIDRLILNANGATKCSGSLFEYCPKLQNVTIEGTIAESIRLNGCDVLSRDSIESIVRALSDTTTGLTLSLPRVAVESAFGGQQDGQWLSLKQSKPNWNITLI